MVVKGLKHVLVPMCLSVADDEEDPAVHSRQARTVAEHRIAGSGSVGADRSGPNTMKSRTTLWNSRVERWSPVTDSIQQGGPRSAVVELECRRTKTAVCATGQSSWSWFYSVTVLRLWFSECIFLFFR